MMKTFVGATDNRSTIDKEQELLAVADKWLVVFNWMWFPRYFNLSTKAAVNECFGIQYMIKVEGLPYWLSKGMVVNNLIEIKGGDWPKAKI